MKNVYFGLVAVFFPHRNKKLSKQKIRESEKSNVSEYEKYGPRSGGLKKKCFEYLFGFLNLAVRPPE